MLFALYVDLLAKRLHLRRVARPPISLINRAARAIDARSAALSEARPGTLIANFHVAADR